MLLLPLVSLLFLLPSAFCDCAYNVDPNNQRLPTEIPVMSMLNNYIYDIFDTVYLKIFTKKEAQLEKYLPILEPFLESKYGQFLSDEYRSAIASRGEEKARLAGYIREIEQTVLEIILKKFFGVEEDRDFSRMRMDMGLKLLMFGSLERMKMVANRLKEVHEPMLEKYYNSTYEQKTGEIRAKRVTVDQMTNYNTMRLYEKISFYAYGITENQFFGRSTAFPWENLTSPSDFKSFIEENYKHILEKEIEIVDVEKEEKDRVMKEIKERDAFSTQVFFTEITTCGNVAWTEEVTKTIERVDYIADKVLDKYAHFRSLEELKETNKRIQEVYGKRSEDLD